MVKFAHINGLLDNDCESSKFQRHVKQKLHDLMQQDKDLTPEDMERTNPCNSPIINVTLQFIKNPVRFGGLSVRNIGEQCNRVMEYISASSELNYRVHKTIFTGPGFRPFRRSDTAVAMTQQTAAPPKHQVQCLAAAAVVVTETEKPEEEEVTTPTNTPTKAVPCGSGAAVLVRTESKPTDIHMRSAANIQHHHPHNDSSFRLIPKASKQMSFSESVIDRRRSLSEFEEVSPQSDYDDNTYRKVLVSAKPIAIKETQGRRSTRANSVEAAVIPTGRFSTKFDFRLMHRESTAINATADTNQPNV